MYINPGFSEQLEKEHKEEKDFDFLGGGLPDTVLVEDGDWRPYYPVLEIQRKAFDTYSCVSFANCNITEMMHKRLYGEEINYSDRFMSVVSNTVPGRGNSHKNVAESRRKKGSVLEEEYPFTDSMSQSEFFKSIPQELKDKGLTWTVDYEYGYETVRREDFANALKFSPIQVAVDSRTNKTKNWQGADHSVVLTYKDPKTGKNWVYDSYLNRYQEYDADYPFSYGQRYHYKKIITLNFEDMSLQLIKGDKKPEIYLLDYDGILHHIDAPTTLEELFGSDAWNKFIVKPQAEVDAMPEGVKVSTKGQNLIESLKLLIQSFGKKK